MIHFIIVGDLRTPSDLVRIYIDKLDSEYLIEYWDVEKQEKWIKETYASIDEVNFAIPWNSIRRRNFGYLRALELGANTIITIDDDNYPADSDWLKEHAESLDNYETLPTVSSHCLMLNPCVILKFNYDAKIYSRGFPLSKLYSDKFFVKVKPGKRTVLNMGLWFGSPDVNAYANILYPNIRSLGIKEGFEYKYAIDSENFAPINTQNTAFVRELTPAFYTLLMDTKINGIIIDRYDDIWSGFFILKLIHNMGHRATFGTPLTHHIRNKHDYVNDFKHEFLGMALTDRIFNIVMNVSIESRSYIEGYLELVENFEKEVNKFFNDNAVLNYFRNLSKAMKIWVSLCEKFL